jgi:hypothetical protein
MGPEGAFITGSDFLMDGGVTAAYLLLGLDQSVADPAGVEDGHWYRSSRGARGPQMAPAFENGSPENVGNRTNPTRFQPWVAARAI